MKTSIGLQKIKEEYERIKEHNLRKEKLAESFKTLIHGDVWWHNNFMEERNLYELANAGALIAMEIERIEADIEKRGHRIKSPKAITIDRWSGKMILE